MARFITRLILYPLWSYPEAAKYFGVPFLRITEGAGNTKFYSRKRQGKYLSSVKGSRK